MSNELIVNTNDANFEADVLQADGPVLVDYWAPWCGPCKMMAPILDELSGTYQGKVKIVKIDVEANPAVARKFGIRNIPTLTLFNSGNIVESKVGSMSKSQLTAFLDSNI